MSVNKLIDLFSRVRSMYVCMYSFYYSQLLLIETQHSAAVRLLARLVDRLQCTTHARMMMLLQMILQY